MYGTHQYDMCCLNLSFLKHEGFCAFFYLSQCPAFSKFKTVPKELDLLKMEERKGGTAVQIWLPVANKNVYLYII